MVASGDMLPSGRDRAIETLIDMESQGAMYRTGRLLEEAIPQALFNRPNLVTRAALVEQAYALREHEVDTVEQYDAAFGVKEPTKDELQGGGSNNQLPSSSIGNSDKLKRIIRHHSKIVTLKKPSNPSDSINAAANSPSSQLVAALRQVFSASEEDDAGKDQSLMLGKLLKCVMNHPVFQDSSTTKKRRSKDLTSEVANKDSSENDASDAAIDENCSTDPPESTTTSPLPAPVGAYALESQLTKLFELTIAKSSQNSDTLLDGLLISILSILTTSQPQEESGDGVISQQAKDLVEGNAGNNNASDKSIAESDPNPMPTLQVGALLSTMALDSSASSSLTSGSFGVPQDLLDYFGEAASIYEERLEIQTDRLLEKRKTEQQRSEASAIASALQLLPGSLITPKTTRSNRDSTAPVATAVVPDSDDPEDQNDNDEDDDDEDDDDDDDDLDLASAAISAALFERIIAAATAGNNDSSDEDPDDDDEDSSSDDDSDDSYEHINGPTADLGFGENPQSEAIPGSSNRIGDASSSSSSSSSNNGGTGDRNTLDASEADEEQAAGEDDEDFALRQALALSLVDSSNLLADVTEAQSRAARSPGPVTPGADSPRAGLERALDIDSTVSDDSQAMLPPLPQPPKTYPYANLVPHLSDAGRSKFSLIRQESAASDKSSSDRILDPSSLDKFGSLPAPQVLLHLFRFMEHLLLSRLMQNKNGSSPGSTKGLPNEPRSVAGGLGCTLFPPSGGPIMANEHSSRNDEAGKDISIQLLVSLFVLLVEERDAAIDNLIKAAQQESQALQEEREEVGDANKPISSVEEEDPAAARAPEYSDSFSGTSEASALEAKGMSRKAAAAAHDAANVVKVLKRRTQAWKERVKLLSECSVVAMRSFGYFLQGSVRSWLHGRASNPNLEASTFPAAVVSKLSTAISSLVTTSKQKSLATTIEASMNLDSDDVLLQLQLYKCAIKLWGECIPLSHPSTSSQLGMLKKLLRDCAATKPEVNLRVLDEAPCLPTSDLEQNFHKLQLLCRRMRVSDILDNLVPSPVCHIPESARGVQNSAQSEGKSTIAVDDAKQTSDVVKMIRSSVLLSEKRGGDLYHLYLAICHRCHVRLLLWNGLLGSDCENDEGVIASTTAQTDSIRVSSKSSSALQFDATKCADSIAILTDDVGGGSNGASVHQRASKVWGTVLSANSFSPKTGVHRWAVRLDKCERGHVFVGVATAQASMKTYVGGDKYGWGMIGTQALWHDRRKIRGDYGATFRTGSTIIVTLDTDVGTLSFTSWRDGNNSSSFSLDPLSQGAMSPRRLGPAGGMLEEWGVAFEGLPLDSKLYPSVGLYQRDDRVTLLAVESGGRSSGRENSVDNFGGVCYYPPMPSSSKTGGGLEDVIRVRQINDSLAWDGTQYVCDTLEEIVKSAESGDHEFHLKTLLPALAASLSLVPPWIPSLSKRSALALLPRVSGCITALYTALNKHNNLAVQAQQLHPGMMEGKWIIRATGSTGTTNDAEEYVVDITKGGEGDAEEPSKLGFAGKGVGTTGKSKNGLVNIFGTNKGSSIIFVEEWSDSETSFSPSNASDNKSSCVATCRLSLDGSKFEGSYKNVQYGSQGQIAGFLCSESIGQSDDVRLKAAPAPVQYNDGLADYLLSGEVLLCLGHGHLVAMIGDGGDDGIGTDQPNISPRAKLEWTAHSASLNKCFEGAFMSQLSLPSNRTVAEDQLASLGEKFAPPPGISSASRPSLSIFNAALLEDMCTSDDERHQMQGMSEVENFVINVDRTMTAKAGGTGSLSVLSPKDYHQARINIICVLVKHCDMVDGLRTVESDNPSKELVAIWRASLVIMESEIRNAITDGVKSRREQCMERCALVTDISVFLFNLDVHRVTKFSSEIAIHELKHFYTTVTCSADIEFLRGIFVQSAQRGILRLLAVNETSKILRILSKLQGSSYPLALESITMYIPRILGKADAVWKQPTEQKLTHPTGNVGGHYLSNLVGAQACVLQSLRKSVVSLFQELGVILKFAVSNRDQATSTASTISWDSLTISVLASFVTTYCPSDADAILESSGLFDTLPQILALHRPVLQNYALDKNDEVDEQTAALEDLQALSQRDLSRSILKSSAAAAHVGIFQNLKLSNRNVRSTTREAIFSFLLNEFQILLPLIEGAARQALLERRAKQETGTWLKIVEANIDSDVSSSNNPERKAAPTKKGKEGLRYIQEHGLHSMITPASTPSKSSGRSQRSAVGKAGKLDLSNDDHFSYQFLGQWFNILMMVSKLNSTSQHISSQQEWMELLFHTIGLKPVHDSTASDVVLRYELRTCHDAILPARYRCRIIRMMMSILGNKDPTKSLVEGLFELAGANSKVMANNLLTNEDYLVRNEVVSLLRQLYLPHHPSWRKQINSTMLQVMSGPTTQNMTLSESEIGVLVFLNGGLNPIQMGSYVLMKPSAAASLGSDQQASLSMKGHNSGGVSSSVGNVPHHIIGNGTEGIIAGLCRADASAGIVSSIDVKNGLCEVVLLARQRGLDFGRADDTGDAQQLNKGVRHSLTVRALRCPLGDVVQAQEIPMSLVASNELAHLASTLLSRACQYQTDHSDRSDDNRSSGEESKNSAKHDISTAESSVSRKGTTSPLCASALALRATMTLLSDKEILSNCIQREGAKPLFSNLLRLAYRPDKKGAADSQKTNAFLSSLNVYEARCSHLLSVLNELNGRMFGLGEVSQSEWDNRKSQLLERFKSLAKPEPKTESGEGSESKNEEDGDTVSPQTPPIASSSAATNEAGRSDDSRAISQSTAGSDNSDEDEENEAAATAATHLREAAIAQMAEIGLSRSWSELALRRTGGTNIEAAVHFCLERGGEMERLLAEERDREQLLQQQSASGSGRRRGGRSEGTSNHLLRQLLEMGFPSRWCAEALTATGNNVDEALTWILTNGERLSAEDEGMEDEEDEDVDDEGDDDEDEESQEDGTARDRSGVEADGSASHDDSLLGGSSDQQNELGDAKSEERDLVWEGSVTPLRFISGRSIIDPKTLAISGLPSGGFSSVGTKGILLTEGKWYYEAVLETAGCLQIGWADGSFAGHCHADRGDGCGDGPSSWAFDGWRRYRWHSTATEWGCRWKEGDVVGCLVDMDDKTVSFTLNGRSEEIGMGKAFSGQGFRPCGGVYACVSFNRREKLRLILGETGNESFKYMPPDGYRGVGVAVLQAVEERDHLVSKECILDAALDEAGSVDSIEKGQDGVKRFLCDFSDGEHGHELMAWAHRYYGSDASVHLGSGRVKHGNNSPKTSNSTSAVGLSPASCLDRRLDKMLPRFTLDGQVDVENLQTGFSPHPEIQRSFEKIGDRIVGELDGECEILTALLAQKFLLHIMLTMGADFDPSMCYSDCPTIGARKLWTVLENSFSLLSTGWVGEAGSMALAAEALGLGISSNEHTNSRHSSSEKSGVSSAVDLDEGLFLPVGGITQILTSIMQNQSALKLRDTGSSIAAAAEAVIGSDGGSGILVFLRQGLQSAICKSVHFRSAVLAAIRRGIRLLSVVEYDGDDAAPVDSSDEGDDAEDVPGSQKKVSAVNKEEGKNRKAPFMFPDARLVSLLSGLLLSPAVVEGVGSHDDLKIELFEAWSVGLLSASLPWRMVSAFTASGILNSCQSALLCVVQTLPTLCRFYSRLKNTVARRVWAERAAVPICSRYVQAMIELLSSVERAIDENTFPTNFVRSWKTVAVDAATPLPVPMPRDSTNSQGSFWEIDEGWVSGDAGYEVLTGSVDYMAVEWKAPSRSAVRTLMDGGDGPPMLREGCFVMRGMDWDASGKNGSEDGKDIYEAAKAKREEKKKAQDDPEASPEDEAKAEDKPKSDPPAGDSIDPADDVATEAVADSGEEVVGKQDKADNENENESKKKKRIANPKLALGTVIGIEAWNGVQGMARRVRWHLTGKEGLYRYGGDGGRYDISHVEVNDKATRVRKRHPLPESAEQCAARHGFGIAKRHNILLRLRRSPHHPSCLEDEVVHRSGILEWPDFGAGVEVDCVLRNDGSMTLTEKDVVFGAKDSGWEARFGHPSYIPGTQYVMTPVERSSAAYEIDVRSPYQSLYEEIVGSTTYLVPDLRNRDDGGRIRLTSEMRFSRPVPQVANLKLAGESNLQSTPVAPMRFDRSFHASSLSLSRDGRTVSCISSDGRGTAYASVGFTKGVHYWEVKIEQADIGSVFIGVAEKPSGSGGSGSSFGYESQPRLNRWHGWGFVNFRATYTAGAERVYGAHCHAGDTVGVLLDCDTGRLSFFFDGLKYGEHIMNDLGCAFENLSPFGFNVDGCGSGGAAQGAPSGIDGGRSGRYPAQGVVRPRALWPVIGLRNHGDRVTISSKWSTSYGIDSRAVIDNVLATDKLLSKYSCVKDESDINNLKRDKQSSFPQWFMTEAFRDYQRWHSASHCRANPRGAGPHRLTSFGLDVNLDCSALACASASALLGLPQALLSGDKIRLKRSAGRVLELAEEAVILGTHQGRLYYRITSQKSEGGSLTEGGGRPWYFDESEVVDTLHFIEPSKGHGIALPIMSRFRCTAPGGLKIVFSKGAVVRSDLEIFDGSRNLGSIPVDTVIGKKDVLERRVNSCGVVRYRVRYDALGEGWISSRIRGGKEEPIVTPVKENAEDENNVEVAECTLESPLECAQRWFKDYKKVRPDENPVQNLSVADSKGFEKLVEEGVLDGLSETESDIVLSKALGSISDCWKGGDAINAPFEIIASAVAFAIASTDGKQIDPSGVLACNQAAARALLLFTGKIPTLPAVMARLCVIRAINRRCRLALPWMPIRPSQEGTAILGGIYGNGASVDRAGRNRLASGGSSWVSVPSLASKIRHLRGLIFSSVKHEFLHSVTGVTATPTPLSHDEYELPREIRTVRLNRLKARRVVGGSDIGQMRKYSVFSQLQNETKGWGGAALRRGFVAKGHGGQKRAFKVKLIGEGVNDYSGPYREAFTDAIGESHLSNSKGSGLLGVLDPTPNNLSEVGENRELRMFSLNGKVLRSVDGEPTRVSAEEREIREVFSSLMTVRDEAAREVEESLVFLGRIAGTAFRHGIALDMPLPLESVWKAISEEMTTGQSCLNEIDTLSSRQGDGTSSSALLWWQQRMLNAFVEGLCNVLPVEILPLFSGDEIRDVLCGRSDIDVDLLERVVEYEGYAKDDETIRYFWETLRELSNDERKMFLQFVWARNRLPNKESEFDAPFKIQKDVSKTEVERDQSLPSASTCFFSLSLPEYSSKDILKRKLLFAIRNVTTMETDFQTNSAEIAEGYRAF